MGNAIEIERLCKEYHLHGPPGEYQTLRESIMWALSAPWRGLRRLARGGGGEPILHRALQDVSFAVKPGEVVGVVGRNGAGKSTLLKILSRITEPSSGRVRLRGRVGSLLEVGTGFHHELTGRENIYLSGAILGMTRREIDRKFDEIVAFAEVGPFLDTPVKRYSSGMYVRLAFAVAAHLETEILIVDEVLAVGDVAFQSKCLGRMRDVSRGGRTVLFVSHNMAAVESLCDRAVLLERGQLTRDGEPAAVIADYHRSMRSARADRLAAFATRRDGRPAILRYATLIDDDGRETEHVPLGGTFRMRIGFETDRPIENPTIGLGIDDSLNQRVMSVHTPVARVAVPKLEGKCEVECRVENFPLAPGDYWVRLVLTVTGHHLDAIEQAVGFTVVNADAFGEGRGFHRGLCVAPSNWTVSDRFAPPDSAE